MGTGLKQAWGLTDAKKAGSDRQAQEFKAAFQGTITGVGASLSWTAENAEKGKHDEKASLRDRAFEAYQSALSLIDPSDPGKAARAIQDCLNEVKQIAGGVDEFQRLVDTAKKAWEAVAGGLERVIDQVAELQEWGSEKAAPLLNLVKKIQDLVAKRMWEEAKEALETLMEQLDPVWDEYEKQKGAKEKYDKDRPKLEDEWGRLQKAVGELPGKVAGLVGEITRGLADAGRKAEGKDFVAGLADLGGLANTLAQAQQAVDDEKKKASGEVNPFTGEPVTAGGGTATEAPPAGSSARQFAPEAQRELHIVQGEVKAARRALEELAETASKADTVKERGEAALAEAAAAGKAFPATPKVAKPEGKTAKEKYASALKINADVSKGVSEMSSKYNTLDFEVPRITEAADDLDKLHGEATKRAKDYESHRADAEAALGRLREIEKEAEAASQGTDLDKVKQAVKAAGKDLDTLEKGKRPELATVASACKGMRVKEHDGEKLRKQHPEKDLLDAMDAGNAAYAQAQEAKRALSGDDATEVLAQHYEDLGGDPALEKLLAAEDKAFDTRISVMKQEVKQFALEANNRLDAREEDCRDLIDSPYLKADKEFIKANAAPAQKAQKAVQAVGPKKLATEPGKALQQRLQTRLDELAEFKRVDSFNEGVIEARKKSLQAVKKQRQALKAEVSAYEDQIKSKRVEYDNALQIKSMDLSTRVDNLEFNTLASRKKLQQQLEQLLDDFRRRNRETIENDPPGPELKKRDDLTVPEPDWSDIGAEAKRIAGMSLDALREDDPALEAIREKYEAAGGDPALHEQRLKAWSAEAACIDDTELADEAFQESQARTGELLTEKSSDIDSFRRRLDIMKPSLARDEKLAKALSRRRKSLSEEDAAALELLERDLPARRKELAALEQRVAAAEKSKKLLEQQVESNRSAYEFKTDPKRRDMLKRPKPKPSDLDKMPIQAKYDELTG